MLTPADAIGPMRRIEMTAKANLGLVDHQYRLSCVLRSVTPPPEGPVAVELLSDEEFDRYHKISLKYPLGLY